MVLDLFINFLVLVAFVFIGGNLSKEQPLSNESSFNKKVLVGLMGSLMAVTMMLIGIKLPDSDIMVDLRNLVLIIMYYQAGIIPAVITGIAIIGYRIFTQGLYTGTYVAILNLLLFIIVFYFVGRFIKRRVLQLIMNFILVHMILFSMLLLFLNETNINYLFIYLFITIFGYIQLIFLLKYVETSNELYRKHKINATKDFLTGLNNTRQFDILFNRTMNQISENHDFFSVLMMDLDHFKSVNDQYGHKNGDLVLIQLSSILKNHIMENISISRVGGEEFCILAVGYNKEEMRNYAENLREYIEDYPFEIDKHQIIHLTASMGLAIYPDTTKVLDQIIDKADVALYNSKLSGRNKVSIE